MEDLLNTKLCHLREKIDKKLKAHSKETHIATKSIPDKLLMKHLTRISSDDDEEENRN